MTDYDEPDFVNGKVTAKGAWLYKDDRCIGYFDFEKKEHYPGEDFEIVFTADKVEVQGVRREE